MATRNATDWRETQRQLHEAHAEAAANAVTALLEVIDAVGADFALSNALTRLEKVRSEAEQAAARV